MSGATVNRELAHLSAFFAWAQGRGWVPDGHNPARAGRPGRRPGVGRFPEPWRPWQTLPLEAEETFWAAFPPRERIKAQLLLELGVRMGVVLNLDWRQVDWPNRLIHYTSKRISETIPLNDRAVELLEALDPKPSGRLFLERTTTTFRRAWGKACKAVGLSGFRRHDLRVTFARRLADEGVDLKTISSLLGHRTITMTARYIPADLQARRDAVGRLRRPRGIG